MMKMTTRKFVWGIDNNRDVAGWIPSGMPNFDTGTGQTVAHDSIEHFSAQEGIENEMLAFGAMIYIRGEGSYLQLLPPVRHRNRDYWDYGWHLSGDFARFLAESGANIKAPRNSAPVDETAEELIASMVRHSASSMDDEMEVHSATFDRQAVIERAVGWIRCGYRAAQKRFGSNSPDEVCYMFHRIETEIDEEHATAEEGDTLIVRFSTETLEHTLTLKPRNYWE